MSITKGYSLWLLPQEDIKLKYQSIISKLSNEHSFPSFEPHITLLGEVEGEEQDIVNKTQQLVNMLKPLILQAGPIKAEDFFFRAVYVQIEASQDLLKMHRNAEFVFNAKRGGLYNPHMSLMYGDYSQDIKENIIKDLGSLQDKFTVDVIRLVRSQGTIIDWKTVTEFSF